MTSPAPTLVVAAVLLCLGFTSHWGVCASTYSVGGDAPFRPWANYECPADEATECDPAQYALGAFNRTQTGERCRVTGCCPWVQGWFPRAYESGFMRNGGIPQRANLTAHLEALTVQVQHWLPDTEWAVHAVLDFEAWTPIWEHNTASTSNWHWRGYKQLSIEYAQHRFPNVSNASQIEEIAKAEFEEAGVRFFAETLKLLNQLRPKALWGFYGFPYKLEGPCVPDTPDCGYDDPAAGPAARALDDVMAPVWRESRAFYPSVYVMSQGWQNHAVWQRHQFAATRGVVAEAARLSSTYSVNGTAAVLPLLWALEFPPFHNVTAPVDRDMFDGVLRNAYQPPLATQLIMWGGGGESAVENAAALRAVAGPALRSAVASADACSRRACSGHGWCDAEAAFGGPGASRNATCACYAGYTGPSCAEAIGQR